MDNEGIVQILNAINDVREDVRDLRNEVKSNREEDKIKWAEDAKKWEEFQKEDKRKWEENNAKWKENDVKWKEFTAHWDDKWIECKRQIEQEWTEFRKKDIASINNMIYRLQCSIEKEFDRHDKRITRLENAVFKESKVVNIK